MPDYHSYDADSEHGLSHNPFKALITPRPIGWISSLFEDGSVNLAPYSYFNALCDLPPIIGFSSVGKKHSLLNIQRSGEFVHNLVSAKQMQQMNITSMPLAAHESEVDAAGLELVASDKVSAPRVAGAPAALECKLVDIRRIKDADGEETNCWFVTGQVVRIHIDKTYIHDGLVDQKAMGLMARLGYFDYAKVETVIAMPRPRAPQPVKT